MKAIPPHGFEAECADFPGCRVSAPTREEALERIREAILFYLESCPCEQIKPANLPLQIVNQL